MRIYISLPISSRPEHEAREHADRVKAALSRAGHTSVNPFESYLGKDAQYIDHLCADLRMLYDCNAICLCDGWQFSKGCRIEANFAREFGKEIMYERKTAQDDYYFNR